MLFDSTCFEVVRSQVRTVWSHDEEYATVESPSLKTAADATSVCPPSIDSGPRCGACEVSDLARFRRLFAAVDAERRRDGGASGAEDAVLDHRPTLWSLDAESMREVAELTSTLSTPDLWPYNSKVGRIVFSSSLYFHTRTVRSLPADTSRLLERLLSALIDAVCPLPPDVASRVPCVASQALIRPSYEPDTKRA